MKKKSKKATEMNDKELLRALFPKPIRDELKKIVAKTWKKGAK
jgi:hypothetical protein